MRVAIVGFPLSGKSTLFMAVSGLPRDHTKPSEESLAAVKIPEPRLDWLEEIYQPKKRTEATMEFVDLPGSTEGESEHAGLTKHLPTLRQADALLVIVRAFESPAVPPHRNRIDPRDDLTQMRNEMLLADLQSCANRIDRLEKAVQKASKERDQQKHELALLQRCADALQNEKPLRDVVQPGEEEKMLRSFGFLTQKPVVVAVNINEMDAGKPAVFEDPHAAAVIAVCAPLEAELIQVDRADRAAFMADYGITALARDRVIRACFDALGMICFLTCGEDEVRAWPVPKGASAVEAAGKIHSDLARGFIKAETVAYDDLHATGSMRAAKAAGKVRLESKTYIVQDGDIMNIKFNV